MKHCILIPAFLLLATCCVAQAGKKASTDKPPTQKEMADMMKEMEQAMKEISPEDKKMMDSMGIKMPDTKNIQKTVSGISDADLKKAYADEARVVPQKDPARITVALATNLNKGNLNAFVKKTHLQVIGQLTTHTKSTGAEIMQEVVKLKASVANTAVGLWLEGKPTLALYLMGEACVADPENDNNLNNYASFLTTCGGEQLALPILSNLNKRYPQNSTVLNNIASAWLGLGEIQRAEKYADSAIRIYPGHPQANMIKCVIEESKGNIPAAIAAARKSINEAYSNEKADKLKKLGYELKSDDINWDRPRENDQLGLDRFTWPEYPMEVEQNKLSEIKWKEFKAHCEEKIADLQTRQKKAEDDYEKVSFMRIQQAVEASKTGGSFQPIPGYAAKAMKKLGPSVNDVNGNMSFVFAEALEPVLRAKMKMQGYEDLLAEKQALLDKKYEDKIGEGRENPLEQICKDENAIRSEFLRDANGLMQSAYRQYLHYVSRRTSDLMYFYQYTLWPEQFELVKVNAQLAWLTQIKDQTPAFRSKSTWCIPVVVKKSKVDSLQNFDDVACKYISVMNLGVYKIISSCSNLTGEFDFKGIKINIKDNVETGKYSGTAIVGISESIGPTSLKAKGTLAALVEIDNTGFTDAGLIAGAAIKAGPVNLVGVEMKATFNTGISTSGKFLGKK